MRHVIGEEICSTAWVIQIYMILTTLIFNQNCIAVNLLWQNINFVLLLFTIVSKYELGSKCTYITVMGFLQSEHTFLLYIKVYIKLLLVLIKFQSRALQKISNPILYRQSILCYKLHNADGSRQFASPSSAICIFRKRQAAELMLDLWFYVMERIWQFSTACP